MEVEDDNSLLSQCVNVCLKMTCHDDLGTEAFGLRHADACGRPRVAMLFH